jgi:hypothetical protein
MRGVLRVSRAARRYDAGMIDDQFAHEHWLTYTEAAEKLGLTVNAVRALARRQGWPRRSPNVIGGQAWVAVPAERIAINGRTAGDRRSAPAAVSDQTPVINGHDSDEHRPEPASIYDHAHSDRRSTEILAVVQEMVDQLTQPLREQTADLKSQLAAEKMLRVEDKERADRAEERTRAAEDQVRELQEQLTAELIEHRRIVGLMAEQLAARRSWWPWRRRS